MSRRGHVIKPRLNTDVDLQHGGSPVTGKDNSVNELSDQYLKMSPHLEHRSSTELRHFREVSGLEIIEGVAAVGELLLHCTTLRSYASHSSLLLPIANLVQWTYVVFLVAISITSARQASPSNRLLKQHRMFLYVFNCVVSVLLFRSVLIHQPSRRYLMLRIFDLVLITLLVLIMIGSSNEAQELQLHEESLKDWGPPREPFASFFSLATFMWVDPIIWRGYRKILEISDVWDLPAADKANRVLAGFRQAPKSTKMAVHLLVYHRQELLVQGLWAVCSAVFTFAPTLLIKLLLEFLEDPSASSASAAWLYVVLLFISGFLKAIAEGQASWLGKKVAIHLRAIVVGEIFSKALKRKFTTNAGPAEKSKSVGAEDRNGNATSPVEIDGEKKQATNGNVTNLMAVDSFKIANVTSLLHLLWASVPVELIIGITMLYSILGYASIAGLAIMVVLIPIKIIIARGFSKVQARIMTATDSRIQMTSELLQSIRIIKYLAYEDRFLYDVQDKRTTELRELRHRFTLWTLAVTVYSTTPILITFFSFLIYTVVEQKTLRPSVAFPALSLFALLRIPLDKLAETLASVQEAMVSVDRVEAYLNESETDKYRQLHQHGRHGGASLMGLLNATFTWVEGDAKAFCMSGVTVSFVLDGLNVIIGPTGSGKTSLLLALIGEMNLIEGSINYPGDPYPKAPVPGPLLFTESVAYCAQQAWLVNDSIEQNILFGSSWDPERYSAVVAACALKTDLEVLPAGDNTMIGEKGIKLSGGQKQRVALARAVYSKARYVLLDDCLSAVDSHTAEWIIDHCLTGDLMRNRTCVLITHNVALSMHRAKHVVMLDNGKVIAQGSADSISSSNILRDQPINSDSSADSQSSSYTGPHSTGEAPSTVPSVGESTQQADLQGNETEHIHNVEDIGPVPTLPEPPGLEVKATGAIKWKHFRLYFTAFGRWYYWLAMTFMFFANQFSSLSIDLWIREWANSYHAEKITTAKVLSPPVSRMNDLFLLKSNNLPVDFISPKSTWQTLYSTSTNKVDTRYYLSIYAILATVFLIIKAFRMGLLFRGSLSASRDLHSRLLASITRASFRFYDATPFGQMVNRFSRDIEIIDQELAPVLLGFQHAAFSALTIWILISVATPLFIIPGIFVALIYFVIGKLYINSSRDLKRIESLQRSPLYQQLDETLAGIATIRAYGHEHRFFQEALARLDNHSRAFLYLWATNAWLAFRVDVTSALISFLAGAFVLTSAGKISPGTAGLSLTYAITFTEHVLWLVRLYAVNEQNMNS